MSEPCSCGRGYVHNGITYCYWCGGGDGYVNPKWQKPLPPLRKEDFAPPGPPPYDLISWVDDVARAFSYLLRDLRACTARLARSWGILAPLPPDANAPLRHVVPDDTCDMP